MTSRLTFFCILVLCNFQLTFAEPANLGQLKREIIAYHDNGTYEHDIQKIIREARNYIKKQVQDNQSRSNPKPLAIVLDIDETSLSNYQNIVNSSFTENAKQIDQNMLQANATAIKPTLALYQEALKQNINVFFVTGRKEIFRKSTQENLHNAGYKDWAGLYLRPQDYTEHSIIPFKTMMRALISQKGYTVIATIGDQYSDLIGGYAERAFKLPNPYYFLP